VNAHQPFSGNLFSDSQLLDESAVSVEVCFREIVQQPSPSAYHLQERAGIGVILLIGSKVRGNVVDTIGE